ncbi:hypothetical protein HYX19_01420 [Candidatus Woesearchaeota archaeon]|nr:hypothetical protein [Candidatus Woesearchaeota archaeon]
MKDIYENTILCDTCHIKTIKGQTTKEGFPIRTWKCSKCNQVWYHPGDLQDFENFSRLKNKTFQVKLRMVGNSYAVSIPREIIEFEEMRTSLHEEIKREMKDMENLMNKMVYLSMEGPDRVSLSFFGRRIVKPDEGDDDE